jgi:DNA (cytosine-5)-methyltransferase 1
MKVLNLYSGIGGNRKLWTGVDVTAVEYDSKIADVYASLFPGDEVIVADAHKYLLDNYSRFDFIWSSPPCQTHSSMRQNLRVRFAGTKPIYPDMKLYQEIIFLRYNFKGRWAVENVKPYYTPLIRPTRELQRHLFWSNFYIAYAGFEGSLLRDFQIPQLQEFLGIDLSRHRIPNKRQVLRNCVLPLLGLYVFNEAYRFNSKEIRHD